MGFNLEMFFEELLAILGDEDLSDDGKLAEILLAIDFNYKYARQCGNI